MSATRYAKAPTIPESDRLPKGDGKKIIKAFKSLEDYAKVPAMRPENREILMRSLAYHHSNSTECKDWYGVSGGADEVLELVKNGWPEGVRRMTEAFGKLSTSQTATSIRRIRTRGDHGDEFDIHRSLSGGLDKAWTRRVRGKRVASRCVTLYVNGAASSKISSEALFWRGAAVMCLSDLLCEAGYSVEVISGMEISSLNDTGEKSNFSTTCTLKAGNEPMNLNNMAAGLCLAGFLRVLGLAQMASVPYPIHPAFGKVGTVDFDDAGLPEKTIVVQAAIHSQNDATDWITSTLACIESGAIQL